MDMNVALIDSVMNFLKRYNEKYKFDYILGFTKGGNILYANDTLDVTNDVIKELNAAYLLKHGDK
jgi:outer membrane protein